MTPTPEQIYKAAYWYNKNIRALKTIKDLDTPHILAAYAAHCTAELEEELSIWKSVFPDIAPARVMPDRSLLEKELLEKDRQIKMLELKANNSLANNLCPDHRDKQSGKSCLACTIEQKDAEIARLREALRPS